MEKIDEFAKQLENTFKQLENTVDMIGELKETVHSIGNAATDLKSLFNTALSNERLDDMKTSNSEAIMIIKDDIEKISDSLSEIAMYRDNYKEIVERYAKRLQDFENVVKAEKNQADALDKKINKILYQIENEKKNYSIKMERLEKVADMVQISDKFDKLMERLDQQDKLIKDLLKDKNNGKDLLLVKNKQSIDK